MDDLVHISQLESYVSQTQTVLLFLSEGYFSSRNCLREVNHAVAQEKPLVVGRSSLNPALHIGSSLILSGIGSNPVDPTPAHWGPH